MGQSKSKSSQVIENNTVNKDYINSLNETIMNIGVETIVNNAKNCTSAVSLNNSCSLAGSKISGDFNFSGNQSNAALLDFACVNADNAVTQMTNDMLLSLAAEIKTLNETDAAVDLNNAISSTNNTGFGSTGGSSSASSSSSVSNTISNETITNIENIYRQNLNNNFTSNTVSECIGKTSLSNTQDLSNLDIGGSANVECIQTNTLEQIQRCEQLSESINKTMNQTLQELGLKSDTIAETTSETSAEVVVETENTSTGPIQDISTGIAGIFTSIGDIFGFGSFGSTLFSICSICCIVIIVCIFAFFAMQSGVLEQNKSPFGNTSSFKFNV